MRLKAFQESIVLTPCVLPRSRPRNVGEVAYQEEVVQTLERAMESANVS